MFKLNAVHRLRADDTPAMKEQKKKNKQQIDKQIDNKQKLIDNLKKALPSSINKMKVSEVTKINKRKQINQVKDQILDLRLKKEKI